MAAPSETYVDPSRTVGTGSGTTGDPYRCLQCAMDAIRRGSQ